MQNKCVRSRTRLSGGETGGLADRTYIDTHGGGGWVPAGEVRRRYFSLNSSQFEGSPWIASSITTTQVVVSAPAKRMVTKA